MKMKKTSAVCLYDSETDDYVSAADLGITDEQYDAYIAASEQIPGEGHVRIPDRSGFPGRLVYAA
jgi:hypothetical protein